MTFAIKSGDLQTPDIREVQAMNLADIKMVVEITFKIISALILLDRLFDRYLDYKLSKRENKHQSKKYQKNRCRSRKDKQRQY